MKRAKEMVQFLNDSWTPYHAVVSTAKILLANGFQRNPGKRPIHGLGVETYGEVFLHQRVILHRRVRHWGRIRTRERVCYDWCAHGSPCPKLKPKTKVGVNSADGFDASGGATVRGGGCGTRGLIEI